MCTERPRGPGRRCACALLLGFALVAAAPGYEAQRAAMLRTIQSYAESSRATPEGGIGARVLDAMGRVPRHDFVPERFRDASYGDHPLPIGYGQTISQPFIVALMTQLLEPAPDATVLEVGTGSGYQAAVLSGLVAHVHSIEIIPALAEEAAARLQRLGCANVSVRQGDGYDGLPEAAPFDGIIVTAAAAHIPPPLLQQLKPGGRMVIPVGPRLGRQHLTLVERSADGHVRTRQILPVQFVPLTGGH